MIEVAAREDWQHLQRELRPFLARRLARPADVDDVLQDVFLRMQRGLPELRDAQRFGPWVYRIARSALVDHLRRTARDRLSHEDAELAADSSNPSEELQPELECALPAYLPLFVASLPSPYREALILTDLQGVAQREAAERLGLSVSGMKSRVQRGRALLRRTIERYCVIALDARGGIVSCTSRARVS